MSSGGKDLRQHQIALCGKQFKSLLYGLWIRLLELL
jgi:hypothetical protein